MNLKYLLIILVFANQVFETHSFAQTGVSISVSPQVRQFLENNDYTDAEIAIIHSTNSDPRLLAWLEFMQGKDIEGSNLIEKTISQATTNQIDSIVDSIAIMGESSPDNSIAFAKKYLHSEQYNNNPRLKIALADVYLSIKNTDMSRPLLDDVLQTPYSGADLKDALFKLILRYYETKQPKIALNYYQSLFERFPETSLDPGYQMQWCHIAIAAGRPTDALAKLDKLQSDFPDYYSPNVVLFHMAKANAFESLGDTNHEQAELQAMTNLGDKYPQFVGLVEMAKNKLAENAKRAQLLAVASSGGKIGRVKKTIVIFILGMTAIIGLIVVVLSSKAKGNG